VAGCSGGSGTYRTAATLCLETINGYRASVGLPALSDWTEKEGCADGQAERDAGSGDPHGAFGSCGESAQNECPDWPGPPESAIVPCLGMMWEEGPGTDYSRHGHYLNMTNPSYTKVACGFHEKGDGTVWAVQDFR
jgi:hypothetical protein